MKMINFEQSEELKACYAALRMRVKSKFHKINKQNFDDYFVQCYISILEAKKKQKLSFDDMKEIALKETNKIREAKIKEYEKLNDLPNEEYSEDEYNNSKILITNSLEEELSYSFLKHCFFEFLKNNVTYNKQFIIDKLLNKVDGRILAKKYKISVKNQTELIYKFRQEFLKYLVEIEYFESDNNYKIDRISEKATALALWRKKRSGQSLEYAEYASDMKIYKLMRENISNINEYAKAVFISRDKLEKILRHNIRNKLYLYQINILRKQYFNNYTLEELVS